MPDEDPFSRSRVLIVAAHPDDEVIGAGGQLERIHHRVTILHATNGSPDRGADYAAAGFRTREEYAAARRQEALCALALAGLLESSCHEAGFADQSLVNRLDDLARFLADYMDRIQPDLVLTHPYEGGHPDHDSCAFATRRALRRASVRPELWEFTSYHRSGDGLVTGRFLPHHGVEEVQFTLSPEQRQRKRKMFECFTTQRHILEPFGVDTEAFRPAPEYDFTRPPHPGPLNYEQFDWGTTPEHWRQRAAHGS